MAEKLDVLALAAHPDDVELCCSGTLIKLQQQGNKTGIVDLTRGEMGTRGTPEQRLEEAEKAAEIMGLTARENLGLPDTKLDNSPEYQKRIIKMLRKYRPHVCLINAPTDRHPDHGDGARLQLDAIFYAGLRKIETFDDQGNAQDIWRPAHTLHYMQARPFDPSFVFDISDTMEQKKKAILAYDSQFNHDHNKDGGPETYISSSRFFESLIGRSQFYGQLIGVEYGEPFLYTQMNQPVPLNSFSVFNETSPIR